MCGIHCIVYKRHDPGPQAILAMMQAARHRGPDGGHYIRVAVGECVVYLGHNLLKIRDISDKSIQPLAARHGSWLVYNGELYGPEKDLQFAASDSVWLYEQLSAGKVSVADLDGMFAFGYLKADTGCLTLARDRHGMKPLYYAELPDKFIASSELRSIIHTGYIHTTLDFAATRCFFTLNYMAPGHTPFNEIKQLLHGQYLLYDLNQGQVADRAFYHTSDVYQGDAKPDILQLDKILHHAVERHLAAQVPVGIMYSGGVDSTLLLYYASKYIAQIPAYMISTSAYRPTVEPMVATLGGQFIEIPVSHEQFTQAFLEWPMDMPVADSAAWLTYLLCREAGHQVKVLLNGAGADEYYAGYRRHLAWYWYLQLRKLAPRPMIKLFKRIRRSADVQKWLNALPLMPYEAMVQLAATDAAFTGMLRHFREHEQLVRFLQMPIHHQSLESYLWFDKQNYLPYDVLSATDQGTMAQGIEVRLPFLDHQLTHYAQKTGHQYLLMPWQSIGFGKLPLRHLLQAKLGKQAASLTKIGFGFPISEWLMQPATHALISEILINPHPHLQAIFDYSKLAPWLLRQQESNFPQAREVFSLLVFQNWLKQFQ